MPTSPDQQEKRLETMARGREASQIAGILKGFIDERITRTTLEMVSHYRGGIIQHEFLLGKTAEITAMLNLLSELENTYRQGIVASQKELGHAQVN